MTTLFMAILNMSITASIAALAVMLARLPLKKAPKTFSYALWAVVLFRLVVPFSIESIFSLMPTSTNAMPQNIVVMQTTTPQPVIQTFDAPISAAVTNPVPFVIPATMGYVNIINPGDGVLYMAVYVWLVGFVALLLYAAISYASLKRRVRYATLVQDNIFETDKIQTPFVLGFIRPRIYFPLTIDPRQQDYILKHEQTHIKRRDYIIKPVAFAVLALHWFNPIIWLSYILMSKDMEMSCDEAVLRNTNRDIRGAYSTSLLNLAVKRTNLLSPIAFGENNVKERVVNVLNFKKPKLWVVSVSVVAVFAFLIGFASNRVVATDSGEGIRVHDNGLQTVIEFDIPASLSRGFDYVDDHAVFIDPITVSLGDVITFDIATEEGHSVFLGLIADRTFSVRDLMFTGGFSSNSGEFTVDGEEQSYYMFVLASTFRDVAHTYIRGTITIDRATPPPLTLGGTITIEGSASAITLDDNITLPEGGVQEVIEVDITGVYPNFNGIGHLSERAIFIDSVIVHPGDIVAYDLVTEAGHSVGFGITGDRSLRSRMYLGISVDERSGVVVVNDYAQDNYLFVTTTAWEDDDATPTFISGTITIIRAGDAQVRRHADGAREVIEVDLPQVPLNHSFVHMADYAVFIDSVTVNPGDVVTFDLYTEAGNTVSFGMTHDRTLNNVPEMYLMGDICSVRGVAVVDDYAHYGSWPWPHMFILAAIWEDHDATHTYVRGTITIDRGDSVAWTAEEVIEQLAGIEDFGITFSASPAQWGQWDDRGHILGNIYHNGQLVRSLIDETDPQRTISFVSEAIYHGVAGEVDVFIIRDTHGSIVGLSAVQV